MNVPNFLTLLRILFIPVLVIVLLSRFNGKELVALILFFLATFTDTLDGLWARRKKQITVFGQLLDPIADKLLITSIFICLVELGIVSSWMVIIIVGREIAVTGFRAIASSQNIHIPASILGKSKMISQTGTIYLLLLGEKYLGQFYILAQIGMWVVVVMAVISAAEYYIKFGPQVLSKDL